MIKFPDAEPEAKKLVSIVKERFARSLRDRLSFERQWHLNNEFINGNQYSLWNNATLSIEHLKRVPNRARPTSNIIIPYRNREIAKLGRNDPFFNVVQNSDEDSDITAARLGEQVLQHLWRAQHLSNTYLELRTFIVDFGTAFLCISWDSQAGQYVAVPKERPESIRDEMGNVISEIRVPEIDNDGNPVIDEANSYYEGDVYVQAASPFAIFVDNNNNPHLDKQAWIMKVSIKTLDEIKMSYGDRGKNIKSGISSITDNSRLSMMIGGRKSSDTVQQDEEETLHIEMQEKPSLEFKEGRLVTIAGEELLRYDPLPGRRYDLIKFIRTPVSRSFWGKSMVEPSIEHQRQWNASLSSVIEHRQSMKKGKLLIPTTAEVRKSAFTDEHAEIIHYNPAGGPPFQMRMESMGTDIWKEREEIIQRMEETWSQHEVSRAQVPGEVKSGVAIEQLIERDDTSLEPTFKSITEGLEEGGSRMLSLVNEFYTEERVVKIVGEEASPEVRTFKGADLRGNTDVIVQIGSVFPSLKVSRIQEIKSRYELGLYGPMGSPEAIRKVLGMLEDPTVISRGNEDRMDELNQKREITMMLENGQPVPITYYDNHEVHLKTLMRMRKSVAIQTKISENPQLDGILFDHLSQHALKIQSYLFQPDIAQAGQGETNAGGPGAEITGAGEQEAPGMV